MKTLASLLSVAVLVGNVAAQVPCAVQGENYLSELSTACSHLDKTLQTVGFAVSFEKDATEQLNDMCTEECIDAVGPAFDELYDNCKDDPDLWSNYALITLPPRGAFACTKWEESHCGVYLMQNAIRAQYLAPRAPTFVTDAGEEVKLGFTPEDKRRFCGGCHDALSQMAEYYTNLEVASFVVGDVQMSVSSVATLLSICTDADKAYAENEGTLPYVPLAVSSSAGSVVTGDSSATGSDVTDEASSGVVARSSLLVMGLAAVVLAL